ncbi:MAG: hypothetical protein V1809_08910 [Planctomycetota bacterium]
MSTRVTKTVGGNGLVREGTWNAILVTTVRHRSRKGSPVEFICQLTDGPDAGGYVNTYVWGLGHGSRADGWLSNLLGKPWKFGETLCLGNLEGTPCRVVVGHTIKRGRWYANIQNLLSLDVVSGTGDGKRTESNESGRAGVNGTDRSARC